MSLTLDIPDEIFQAMRLPPGEIEARLRLELAIALYAQQILSLGKAAELAGVPRWQLNQTLATRGLPIHYTAEELTEDLAYAGRHQ